MAGILAYGAYIPYYRLPRSVINKAWGRAGGRGEKAVANYDEDTVTMAVAAGIDCLSGIDPKSIDALFLATTTGHYKERQNSTIIAGALDLRRQARNVDVTGTLRSGTNALLSALDTVNAGSAKTAMVVAADMRLGGASGENEQNFGDGAAAFLLGKDKVAAEIEGSYTLSDDFVDSWRSQEDILVRNWEDRFGRDVGYLKIPVEAAAGVMKQCQLTPKDFAKVCLYGANARSHSELGKAMGFAPNQIQESLLDTVGNTGSAHALMVLVSALEQAKPSDLILLVSWGNGSDAIVLKVTEEIEKIRNRRGIKRYLEIKKTLDNYEKLLRWRGLVPMEASARPAQASSSLASLWREHTSALPLYGVKCTQCGTPQMFLNESSTRARICVECQAKDQFEPYRFADKRGKLVTFSHDYLAFSQDPPSTTAVIDFDGGGRAAFEMTDRDPTECQVGMRMEMTFRKINSANGLHTYFWKCHPARD